MCATCDAPEPPYLAAVLFGAVGAADRRGGNGACELGVGAQHGVRLSRASRTKLPDARWELSSRMVLQDMGFPLASTFIHLQVQTLCHDHHTPAILLMAPVYQNHNIQRRKSEPVAPESFPMRV